MTAPCRLAASRTALVAVFVALSFAGCWCKKVDSHTKSYDPSDLRTCKPESELCESPSSAKVCVDDDLAAVPCRGPAGCSQSTGAHTYVSCDQSLALSGDRCPRNGNVTCSVDGRAKLQCADGKWVKVADCTRCSHETKTRGYWIPPETWVECQ